MLLPQRYLVRFDDGDEDDSLRLNELRHPRDNTTAAAAAAGVGAAATPAAAPAASPTAAPAAAPPPTRGGGGDSGALSPAAARPAAAPLDEHAHVAKAKSDDDDDDEQSRLPPHPAAAEAPLPPPQRIELGAAVLARYNRWDRTWYEGTVTNVTTKASIKGASTPCYTVTWTSDRTYTPNIPAARIKRSIAAGDAPRHDTAERESAADGTSAVGNDVTREAPARSAVGAASAAPLLRDGDDGVSRDPKRPRSPAEAEAEDGEALVTRESAKRARPAAGMASPPTHALLAAAPPTVPPAACALVGQGGRATATPPREGTDALAAKRTRASPRGAAQRELEAGAAAASAANDAAGDGDDLADDEEGGGEAATGSSSRVMTMHALALSGSEWSLLAEAARKEPRLKRACEAIQTALLSQRPPPLQTHKPAINRSDRGGVSL